FQVVSLQDFLIFFTLLKVRRKPEGKSPSRRDSRLILPSPADLKILHRLLGSASPGNCRAHRCPERIQDNKPRRYPQPCQFLVLLAFYRKLHRIFYYLLYFSFLIILYLFIYTM